MASVIRKSKTGKCVPLPQLVAAVFAVAAASFVPGTGITAVSAQALDDGPGAGFVPYKGPNTFALTCLDDPTNKCAIEAAFNTVIDERLAGERARVLAAVAEAFIAQGRNTEAKQTLIVALDEARGAELSLIYQEKLQIIAPLLARAGDPAAALALTEDARYGNIRDKMLRNIAREAVVLGDIDALRVALRQLRNNRRAFWEELNLLVTAPADALTDIDLSPYRDSVDSFQRSDRKYRGYILLAVLEEKRGNRQAFRDYLRQSSDLFDLLVSNALKMDLTSQRLDAMQRAGLSAEALEVSYKLALEANSKLVQGLDRAAYNERLMTYEARSGRLGSALQRLDLVENTETRTRMIQNLVTAGASDGAIAALKARYQSALDELVDLPTVFDRDEARLAILKGAIGNGFSKDALKIVAAIEDDDSQAAGLALASGLLP